MLPKFLTVALTYQYLKEPVEYKFPRLRKKDAELDDRERVLGDGKRLSPAERLSQLVEDVTGLEELGLAQRSVDESEAQYRSRVLVFFNNDEGQEFAEDALLYRLAAVYPQPMFRGVEDNRVEESSRGKAPVGKPVLPLREVSKTREGHQE